MRRLLLRTSSVLSVVLAGTFASRDVLAQTPSGHQHPGAGAQDDTEGRTLCLICPASRESSGTSWQPDQTMTHPQAIVVGPWRVAVHAEVAAVSTDEGGPRGDAKGFGTNHVMVNAQRRGGGGVIGVRSMWSAEPLMGAPGYPLLLQTGETANGITPLIDRQHPHDFVMELALTYARALGSDRAVYLYVAPAGAPALGPPAFMHRPSAAGLPIAPITHHWFDSTHITYGVVTVGFVSSPRVKFEASAFRGREPDQNRWTPERPKLDSGAFRVSVNPTPSLSVQVSAGYLHDAEQLHVGANVGRITASAMYARSWDAVSVDATVAWGRNNRTTSLIPVTGGFLVFPGARSQATLAEATVRVATRHAMVGRLEHADKDELFPVSDLRHNTVFPVNRVTAGYVLDVARTSHLKVAFGVAGSWSRVAGEIRPDYGGSPGSFLGFLQLATH